MLSLAGCDIVLGIQWLREWETISWTFKNLGMHFKLRERAMKFQGLIATQLIEEWSLDWMNKLELRGIL